VLDYYPNFKQQFLHNNSDACMSNCIRAHSVSQLFHVAAVTTGTWADDIPLSGDNEIRRLYRRRPSSRCRPLAAAGHRGRSLSVDRHYRSNRAFKTLRRTR